MVAITLKDTAPARLPKGVTGVIEIDLHLNDIAGTSNMKFGTPLAVNLLSSFRQCFVTPL